MKLLPQKLSGKRMLRGILRARTTLALLVAGLAWAVAPVHAAASKLDQALTAYDAAIQSSTTAAKLIAPLTLDGTAAAPFDFGATSGDVTMEFILSGDPTAGEDAYLAVGETPTSSLRYAQYQNTRQLGFTQGGVADYLLSPPVPSPTGPAHVAYVWNSTDLTMSVYVNGVLAGSVTGVSSDFTMPAGAGFLGGTAGNTEVMKGTIYRVAVFPGALSETDVKSHADAFASVALPSIASFTATPSEVQPPGSASLQWQVKNATAVYLNNVLVTATNQTVSPAVTTTYTLIASNELATATAKLRLLVNPRLDLYDAAIAADATNGIAPVASLTNTITLSGTAGEPFDFTATSGNVTMEFVLEGDPTAGPDGFLAVGENSTSSLRYAQWQNTQQMGFTQGGVADYLFVPGVPSPTIATHVVYVWDSAALTMKIYVNGVLSGTITNVSPDFAMPTGVGVLGATLTGTEAMTGRIFRLEVYPQVLSAETIQKHATAFTSVLRPPIISSFTGAPTEILGQGSSVLTWQVQDATAIFLNGTNVTGATNQTVSPAATTTYTLIASNNVSTVNAQVRVLVTPILTNYDAVIAADSTNGLTPVSLLTNALTLSGTGGEPFDFGATSGDVTMEFILEGDPTVAPDGYLAVGEIPTSNLRYAQWQNTRQMGFTQLGVADYLFAPAVASPTVPTLVTYVWNTTDLSMSLYTNGVLAGTVTNVTSDFAMPTGAGFLGSSPTGTEGMIGRIFRVTVYPGVLAETNIVKHASAFKGAPTAAGPSLAIAIDAGKAVIKLQGTAGTHYRVEYRDALGGAETWKLLEEIPSLNGASIQVTDPTATTGHPQRFYRAVTVP